MTAINVIKQKHAVHVITDGASWMLDGKFGPACCKVWPVPHLRAVVAARGPRLAPLLMADFLNTAGRSYDEMKANAVTMVRELFEVYPNILAGPFGQDAEFVIAGWSDVSGPDAFVLSRVDGVWISRDTGPVMMAPGDAAIQQAALAAMPEGVASADDMDPARDGLAIVTAQRAIVGPCEGITAVGGFIQITTVTRDRISTRILHTWPEEWGEPQVPPAEAAA